MEEFYNARNGPGSGVKNTSLAVLGKKLTNRCPPSLADHPEAWAQMQKTGQPAQLPGGRRPVPFVLSCRYCGWEPSDASARAMGTEAVLRRHWQREHWNPKVKCQVRAWLVKAVSLACLQRLQASRTWACAGPPTKSHEQVSEW